MKNLASYIDHTILKSDTKSVDIEKLCTEAIHHKFEAVCVPPFFVALANQLLKDSSVKVATVIGFPLGYSCTASKLQEIKTALQDGADEIDFVHNISALKNGDWDYLKNEIATCLQPIRLHNKIIKVIIESGILTDEEIVKSCELYAQRKVDFIKTSTGFATHGASLHAVELIKKNTPDTIQIKASGGIRNFADTMAYLDAGAARIGTSSGVAIVTESAS